MKKTLWLLFFLGCLLLLCSSVTAYNYQTFEIDVDVRVYSMHDCEFWNNTLLAAGELFNGLRAYSYSDEGLTILDAYNSTVNDDKYFDMALDSEGYIFATGETTNTGLEVFSPFDNHSDSFNFLQDDTTYTGFKRLWVNENGTHIFVADSGVGLHAYRYWKENNTLLYLSTTSDGMSDAVGWSVTATEVGTGIFDVFFGEYTGEKVYSYSFNENGTNDFWAKSTLSITDDVWGLAHDDNYLYVSAYASGLFAYTFDRVTGFDLKGSIDNGGYYKALQLDKNKTFIFSSIYPYVRMYTFNGTDFTLETYTETSHDGFNVYSASWDGKYMAFPTSSPSGIYFYLVNVIPDPPTDVTANDIGNNEFRIQWTKNVTANATIIVKKEGSVPTSYSDGAEVYNSTGTSIDLPIEETIYFYRLFSYVENYGYYTYSESGADLSYGGINFNCYNESTSNNLTFDIFISNPDGSQVYNALNCSNPFATNISLIPTGENILFIFSSDGYRVRSYYINVGEENWFTLNAYLVSENDSELYLLQVKNEIDIVVPDTHITFKTYINETIGFGNISSLITDGEGQVNIYLVPGKLYKIIITAIGYDTGISDYYPSDSIFTHTLRIYFSNGTGEPKEYLFDNIGWSITPTDPYHNNSIDVAYTINSDDGKLEWFNATVHVWNSTNEIWVLLYAENITDQPTGGTIDYTIANNTGKYSFTCRFKKEGFPVYTFGTEESCRIYYIYLPDRGWGIENIPSFIYMLITIVLMIGATGLLAMVGAGEASGFGGMGVMAIMFTINPGLLVGGISCWFVLLVAVIVYGAFLFVMKG